MEVTILKDNSYAIYQVKEGQDYHLLRFASMDELKRDGLRLWRDVHKILAAAEAGTLQQSGWLLPVEHVFASLPALTVDDAVKKHLFNGCPTSHYRAQDGKYRVYDAAGTFLGLANVTQGVLQVEKIFCERA